MHNRFARCTHRFITLLGGVFASGCGLLGSEEPRCDICTTSAIIAGRVTSPTGNAIHNAAVRVDAFANQCGLGQPFATFQAVTDASGSFRGAPYAWAPPFDACIRVVAVPPAGLGLRVDSTSGGRVRFKEDFIRQRHDSVFLALTLPVAQ